MSVLRHGFAALSRPVRLVGFALLLPAAADLAAQSVGTVAGVVVAAADATPVQAHIRIASIGLNLLTAQNGAFRLTGVPVGEQTLDVRMLGYSPVVMPLRVRAGDSVIVRVSLTAIPAELAPMEVTDMTALTPQLRGFEERRSRGMGTFFTREDIRRMQPRLFSDVLRRVPGMQIRSVQGGHGDNVAIETGRKPCSLQFYLNGMPMPLPRDVPVNYYISPEEVVGIEVYNGSSEIPSEFNSSQYNSRCGVVVVWTRVGRDPGPSR
jgi:hypothetical protein